MRSVFRYLSPLIRSRRRISFLFTISLLLSIAFILYIINHKQQSKFSDDKITRIQPPIVKTLQNVSKIIQNDTHTKTSTAWPVDEQGRSLKTHFLALDWTGFFGAGATEGERVHCPSSKTTFSWTRQQNRIADVDFIISHDGQSGLPFDRLKIDNEKQQYTMAFVMESEVHSSTGSGWARYNFKMTYNLDDSYPEPATYFDVNPYIIDLLSPPSVSFEDKEKSADIVWIISNCNAHNDRQGFVQRLMQETKVHSYGSCLNNRQGYGARMADNVDAYKKYKFVIAIENSNCADYVTEKLVKAVQSGSVPIVAGRDGRPDYRRYLPDHSYINVYNYTSIKSLAEEIKRIGSDKKLYESYLWYKKHDKNIEKLRENTLEEKLKHLADVIGQNASMIIDGIAGKEKSENKICKLIRFVKNTPWQDILAHKKTERVGGQIACLPPKGITTYFDTARTKEK